MIKHCMIKFLCELNVFVFSNNILKGDEIASTIHLSPHLLVELAAVCSYFVM